MSHLELFELVMDERKVRRILRRESARMERERRATLKEINRLRKSLN